MAYQLGTDLILSLNGKPIGFSTTCKISNSAETAERVTKERGGSRFKEKYVKSISEQITTEGFVCDDSRTGYDTLKALMATGTPVTLTYCFVGQTQGYSGEFIISSLDLDAPAGDDAKYSLTFENSGAVKSATIANKQERTTDVTTSSTKDITAPSGAASASSAKPAGSH